MEIAERLFEMQDFGYKAFHSRLMPTVDPSRIIGVRVPAVRRLAKELGEDAAPFLESLPHFYYEENNLHAFLLSEIRDFEECVRAVDRFLPYVDNWATCDGLRPKCFVRRRAELLPWIERWMASPHPYAVRFGIEMLMVHFLDDGFDEKYLRMVSSVRREEYYVKMMVAWYFATALAKRWGEALPYLDRLPDWERRKAVRKALESFRITEEQKTYLRGVK